MREKAYPGCQIIVARKGKVIYNENFGYHTYEKKNKVDADDIYDIASITKIVATTPSLMKLQDENKFNLNTNLGDYLPEMLDTSANYKNMSIKAILSHQGRLVSWIPFYLKTLKKGSTNQIYYSKTKDETKNTQVAKDLYILDAYRDTIFRKILETRIRNDHQFAKNKYLYSDLGYYFFKEIIQNQTGSKLQDYTNESFYKPLGLKTMTYLPLEKFSKDISIDLILDEENHFKVHLNNFNISLKNYLKTLQKDLSQKYKIKLKY